MADRMYLKYGLTLFSPSRNGSDSDTARTIKNINIQTKNFIIAPSAIPKVDPNKDSKLVLIVSVMAAETKLIANEVKTILRRNNPRIFVPFFMLLLLIPYL